MIQGTELRMDVIFFMMLFSLSSCSTAHVTSWGNLLVQLSLQPGGRDHALLVRAGLEGIPLEVGVVYKQKQSKYLSPIQADVKLYENLSKDFPAAFKIAIMSKQEELLQRAMEDASSHFSVSGNLSCNLLHHIYHVLHHIL